MAEPQPDLPRTDDQWAATPTPGLGDRVGGPRGYQGPEAGEKPLAWKCPACGADQVGMLADGCSACGSGRGSARHVGVDPIVRKPTRSTEVQEYIPPARTIDRLADLHAAFLTWIQSAGTEVGPLAAFTAGWQARGADHDQSDRHILPADSVADLPSPAPASGETAEAGGPGTPPPTDDEPPAFPPALKRERTLLAALTFFREQVVATPTEETISGEWMTGEEIDQLIEMMKKEYGL